MEGLEEGLYVIGAESNVGKSAILMNLIWAYTQREENKLFGLYFSLDDSKNELIPRLIAMNQQIPISVALKPRRYQNLIDNNDEHALAYQQMLESRKQGIELLKNNASRFKVVDNETIQNGEQIIDYCIKVQDYVRGLDPDANIIVGIDSLADIEWDGVHFRAGDENAVVSYTAKQVKSWSVDVLKCPIFASYHLRKVDQTKRPNIADLKSSGRLVYEASAVFLAHNDVSRNNQNAGIYWTMQGSQELQPVIELQWAKNKKSSFKGRTYFDFYPNESRMMEATDDEMRRYDSLIYSSH